MNASQNTASVMLAAGTANLNGGTLVIYSGTMPATPETALSGNTILATFAFSATAFGAPTYVNPNMQAVANFAAATVSPAASGTATFARTFKSNGTTVGEDYTVGTSGADIIIGNTAVQTGVNLTINSFTLKQPCV